MYCNLLFISYLLLHNSSAQILGLKIYTFVLPVSVSQASEHSLSLVFCKVAKCWLGLSFHLEAGLGKGQLRDSFSLLTVCLLVALGLLAVCFFKTIKKESPQTWLLRSYVMYHVLLVTYAVFCWLEVSLRTCTRAEDHTRAWSWGHPRVCLPNLLILRMKKQAQRDDLAFQRYSRLVEELRVDAPLFNFKPVLEPESGSAKLSMLLNFFEPQFSNY